MNPGRRQRLSAFVQELMAKYFPELDLDVVRLRTNASLPGVPAKEDALTLGTTIFFRGDFRECELDDFGDHMGLLMHELVHVGQFQRLGTRTFACKHFGAVLRWSDNQLEEDALTYRAEKGPDLKERLTKACSEVEEAIREEFRKRSDWFWVMWGSG